MKKYVIFFLISAIYITPYVFAQNNNERPNNDNDNDNRGQQITVTVPANANGNFGVEAGELAGVPLVKAVSVSKAKLIIISYQSGTWCGGGGGSLCSDANGIPFSFPASYPLQQASGTFGTNVINFMALMGAFVPQSVVTRPDFKAVDMTKLTSGIGIPPDKIFFVGAKNYLKVNGPGTLYLGVNDAGVADNSGSLTVEVTTEKE